MSAAWAAAAAGDVGIFDGETLAHRAVDEIDGRPVEMQGHFLLSHYIYAVLLVLGVDGRIELVFESQGILKTGASAAGNAHAKHGRGFQFLRVHKAFDFSGSGFGQDDGHFLILRERIREGQYSNCNRKLGESKGMVIID